MSTTIRSSTVVRIMNVCFASVINFKNDTMHVLIVRDIIDHTVCIGNTAKWKNTEDNKTGSLDPRKK